MNDITYVKQYGLKRTGTNLVKYLLEENFHDVRVLVNVLGWKHGPHVETVDWTGRSWDAGLDPGTSLGSLARGELEAIRDAYDGGRLRYAISVKNPYAWLVSYFMFRRKRGEIMDLSFKSMRERQLRDDVQLYVQTYRSYTALIRAKPTHAVLFRHEDLLFRFEGTMDRVRERFSFSPNGERYVLPARKLGRGNDSTPHADLTRYPESVASFDRSYYEHHLYLEELASWQLELIRELLPEDLMRTLDYPIL